MMSHLLCHFLLLVFLCSRAAVHVKASNNAINCGYDNFCQATLKLMTAVNEIKTRLDELATNVHEAQDKQAKEIKTQLDELATNVHEAQGKQAKDLEELKTDLNKTLASTAAISTQLEKHSTELLSYDERLKASDGCPDVSEKLDKLATNVRDIHSEQLKNVEELKANVNRSLATTAAISTQLDKHSADLLRHDERLKANDVIQNSMYQLVKSTYWEEVGPGDCTDIRAMGSSISGVYRVYTRRIAMDVYCDFRNPTQSWLVFQRRRDGSQNFDRTWSEYAHGFGVLNGEFWLGNEKLSLLTMNKKYKLRIEMEDFLGGKSWAEYSTFSVKPSTDKYRLTVAGYSGNAGDSFYSAHHYMMFSTKDADNDLNSGGHCAGIYPGGWWFNRCHQSNLNGLYLGGPHKQDPRGICWFYWKGSWYSMKATEMKITALNSL